MKPYLKGVYIMKEKLKKFWKDHKEEILVYTAIIGGTVVGIVLTKKIYNGCKRKVLKDLHLNGKSWISWTPRDGSINLERVKEILDLNVNNASRYAIFREGTNPEDYKCILLSDDVKLA